MIKINWLWDSLLSEEEAQSILKDEKNPKFDLYAEKLLSRVSDPAFVFNLMDKVLFCKRWPIIKRSMGKDQWLKTRVVFWQTIYERLHERFRGQGIRIRNPQEIRIPRQRLVLATQIRKVRVKLGYTQRDIAKKLGVIQQYVSKIESGRENVSFDVLKRIADALGKELVVRLR